MTGRSFTINVRTRVGMNEEFKKQFDKWIRLQPYGAYVYETKGGLETEHLHAQIWLDTPRNKGNVTKPMKALIKRCYKSCDYEWGTVENPKCLLIKSAWDDMFVTEYMKKDGGLVYACLPEVSTEFYPTEEEQAKFMEIAESNRNWTLWKELKGMWNPETQVNKINVAKFLGECMFQKKCIKVEMDSRKRMQIATTFLLYMIEDPNQHTKAFLPKETHALFDMMDKG